MTSASHPDHHTVIRALDAAAAGARLPELAQILIECVEDGGGVSFMAPLERSRAETFWRSVIAGLEQRDRILLVAEDAESGRTLGTVQVALAWQDNAPHRGEVCKMLVGRQWRGRGIGSQLLRAAEAAARDAGRTLLTLDTFTGGDAERFYERLGWTRAGVVPKYALFPHGGLGGTTIFYRDLSEA
jgi:GNAT superfamily N-acetyltransferase